MHRNTIDLKNNCRQIVAVFDGDYVGNEIYRGSGCNQKILNHLALWDVKRKLRPTEHTTLCQEQGMHFLSGSCTVVPSLIEIN